jgi:hypothetical protein
MPPKLDDANEAKETKDALVTEHEQAESLPNHRARFRPSAWLGSLDRRRSAKSKS